MASSKKSQPDSQTDNTQEWCPLCGGPNACKLCTTDGGSEPCWCATIKIPPTLLACVPEKKRNRACICSHCVLTHTPPRVSNAARKLALILLLLQPAFSWANTYTENFSANPTGSGWQVFGTNNLFTWDSTNQNLRVTWDSSKPNNYFHHPLGNTLTSADDFSLSFDLTFEDYASGVNPAKLGTFEAAIGLLNLDQAVTANFFRGAGTTSFGPLNLVEFDFFPAFDTFNATIAQTIVGTNHSNANWLYNHENQQEMTPGETFHIAMNYSSVTRTLVTLVTINGEPYGDPQVMTLLANQDFRVTTFSVSSYSDLGQNPLYAGSLLAHGTVDNISLVTPPPPVENLSGGFNGALWQVQFTCRTNWLYTLERSGNSTLWTNASLATPGNGAMLTLSDANPPAGAALYRVRANRP
jgi:hypothetical protein